MDVESIRRLRAWLVLREGRPPFTELETPLGAAPFLAVVMHAAAARREGPRSERSPTRSWCAPMLPPSWSTGLATSVWSNGFVILATPERFTCTSLTWAERLSRNWPQSISPNYVGLRPTSTHSPKGEVAVLWATCVLPESVRKKSACGPETPMTDQQRHLVLKQRFRSSEALFKHSPTVASRGKKPDFSLPWYY